MEGPIQTLKKRSREGQTLLDLLHLRAFHSASSAKTDSSKAFMSGVDREPDENREFSREAGVNHSPCQKRLWCYELNMQA